jgi:hypothetical protein
LCRSFPRAWVSLPFCVKDNGAGGYHSGRQAYLAPPGTTVAEGGRQRIPGLVVFQTLEERRLEATAAG